MFSHCPNVARSTAEEWGERARSCFQLEDYANASLCFERAEDLWWKLVSDAHRAEQLAIVMPVTHPRRITAFRACAEAFQACADDSPTADDFQTLMISSARSFVQAKDHKAAAKAFRQASKLNEAAWHYRLAGCFDEALDIIHSSPLEVDKRLAESITDVAKVVYTKKREIQ